MNNNSIRSIHFIPIHINSIYEEEEEEEGRGQGVGKGVGG